MKIGILADLHLNKGTFKTIMDRSGEFGNIPFRHADFMRAFRWSVDECIKLHPDLVVINGDVYDHPDPGNKVRGFFSAQLERLTTNKIVVAILIGNHDVSQENHALTDIEKLGLGKIIVLSQPKVTNYKNTQLMFFPYSLDIERKIMPIKTALEDFLSKNPVNPDHKEKVLFFGHFSVLGQSMNRYNAEDDATLTFTDTTTTLIPDSKQKEYVNKNKNDIGPEDLDKIGADYIFLGDYHEKQSLKCKTRGWYGGSLEKNSFNEVDHEKGFIFYDSEMIEGDMGHCRFIPYPHCRPMFHLTGSLLDMKRTFALADCSRYQEAIVRLNFYGNKKEKSEFEAGMESFKSEILEKTNAIHLYHNISKVTDEESLEAISRIEKEIQESGTMEEVDVIEVVKEMIFEREKDDKERAVLVSMAAKIYQDTISNRK